MKDSQKPDYVSLVNAPYSIAEVEATDSEGTKREFRVESAAPTEIPVEFQATAG